MTDPGSDKDKRFALAARTLGMLSEGQAREAVEAQRRLLEVGCPADLERVCRERGWLSAEQIQRVRGEVMRWSRYPEFRGYDILGRVGRGGMGSVYRARQVAVDRIVALKVLATRHALEPEYVARFHREARLAARISHPELVAIYSAGEEDGRHFIVMEFVDGPDAADMLEDGALPLEPCLRIARGVASALTAAHERGIVHRDIKPSNVLVAPDGRPKLADLGLAKLMVGDPVKLTKTGMLVGTPAFMSPEQCRAERDIDGRCDIYALGASLFQLATRRLPFPAPTKLGVIRKHVAEPPPDPREVNPVFSEFG